MAEQETNKVSALVPAYNEAARLGAVLATLTTYSGFAEVIVVDDGSTDHTETLVQGFTGVRYLKNAKNLGKGMSMERGVAAAAGDIIFFCDADIHGLTHAMIERIVGPVASGAVSMSIGMRDRKIHYARRFMWLVPLLGGERALTKELWQSIPVQYKSHFKIETALNYYASMTPNGSSSTLCKGLLQTIKERKYGLLEGFRRRLRMIYDITVTTVQLWFEPMPQVREVERTIAEGS